METPCYVFDRKKVISNWNELKLSIQPDLMFYALKANGNIEILRSLNQIGANFEIASPGELSALEKLGVHPERIICSLPVKKCEFIMKFYEYGIRYFVFDTLSEFNKLVQLAPLSKKILRLNVTSIAPQSIPFGVEPDIFFEWSRSHMIDLNYIDGLTFYVSKNKDIITLMSVLNLCEIILHYIPKCEILNIGGNYRLPSEIDEHFYENLRKNLDLLRAKYGVRIYAEPGRSVVKSAGTLLSTIISMKPHGESTWVYIDAGIPTGISYAPKDILHVNKKESPYSYKYIFYDITCSHIPLFEKHLNYDLEPGDVLTLKDFGSYSLAKSSNFHGWASPLVYYI